MAHNSFRASIPLDFMSVFYNLTLKELLIMQSLTQGLERPFTCHPTSTFKLCDRAPRPSGAQSARALGTQSSSNMSGV